MKKKISLLFIIAGCIFTDVYKRQGPVFVPSSNGEGLVAGIHKGSVNSNTKVFVNADNIYAAFGYSRY